MTFVNKMDREARDPFEFSTRSPTSSARMRAHDLAGGQGLNFKGVLDLYTDEFVMFGSNKRIGADAQEGGLARRRAAKLEEESELAQAGLPAFRCRHAIAKAISRRSISARR